MSKRKTSTKSEKESEQNEKEKKGTDKQYMLWNDGIFQLDPYFEQIVQGDEDNKYRFICLQCTKNYNEKAGGYRDGLRKHLESQTHSKKVPTDEEDAYWRCIVHLGGKDPRPPKAKEESDLSEQKEMELYFLLADFLIQNHLPFNATENLLKLIKSISMNFDPKLVQKASLSSTTMTNIITKCIAKDMKEELYSHLAQSPFSLIIDETSDLLGGTYLAIHVKYIHPKEQKITTKLISILQLQSETTGAAIFAKIREAFPSSLKLDNNLIALCTDNASKLIENGNLNLYNRLKAQIPHLIHIRDLCHIYNLIIEKALDEAFPYYVRQFLRQVSAHFSTAQRRAKLIEVQIELGISEPKGMLQFKEIRWNNLLDLSKRIIDLWNPLIQYFKKESSSDLKDNFNEEYYLLVNLLHLLLSHLHHYIIYFQQENLYYSKVLSKIKESYTLACHFVLKSDYSHCDFTKAFAILLTIQTSLKIFLQQMRT